MKTEIEIDGSTGVNSDRRALESISHRCQLTGGSFREYYYTTSSEAAAADFGEEVTTAIGTQTENLREMIATMKKFGEFDGVLTEDGIVNAQTIQLKLLNRLDVSVTGKIVTVYGAPSGSFVSILMSNPAVWLLRDLQAEAAEEE